MIKAKQKAHTLVEAFKYLKQFERIIKLETAETKAKSRNPNRRCHMGCWVTCIGAEKTKFKAREHRALVERPGTNCEP